MANIETTIKWFYDRKGTTYSMVYRLGPSSYDCSSAVYLALIAGGYFPTNKWVGNTDSLYGDLERAGWTQLVPDRNGYIEAKRGDVFLWGKRGASTGSLGHTGIFIDADNIIHCSYGYNGIHVDNHDWLSAINGHPDLTIYRYASATKLPATNAIDQVLEVGSVIKFAKTYRADDVQLIGGVWQVRTNELCPRGFTWADNGIPASAVDEVTDSYRTSDQELDIGSTYVIPGKFTVLDLGEHDGMWLALVEHAGLKFWIDVATATEIAEADSGTPAPVERVPVEIPPTGNSSNNSSSSPEPETPHQESPTPVIEQPTNESIKPKENTMAFSKKDQEKINIQTQTIQELADKVAADAGVQELVSGIDRRVKIAVYIVGDLLIGLGLLIPNLALAFDVGSLVQVVALSSVFATAGAFLLTMFGIYKSGK